jgi:hypothetical protein
MINTSAPPIQDPRETDLGLARRNPAVAKCQKVWKRVNRASLRRNDSPAVAHLDAADAFREAMPLLDSHKNIRDFIACVGYAMAADIFIPELCKYLLDAARVALSAAGPWPGRPGKKGRLAAAK